MARVTNQGADYEEDVTTEEYDEEGGEDTDAKLTAIAGIPIKFIVIGGVVMLLTLLIVIVFSMRKKGGDDNVFIPPVGDGTSVGGQATTGNFTWTTADGAVFGTSNSTEMWTDIMRDGVAVGCIADGGSITITSNTGVTATAISYEATDPDVGGNTSVNDDTASTPITAASEDVETLRKLGYTGDEIDLAISTGMDVQAMIDAAQALQDEAAKEAIERMGEFISPEFQHIYNNSIFFMPEQPFPEEGDPSSQWDFSGSYLVNADYEKMDTYGYQLWIKVKIANDTYAFMCVTPARWETLPQTGNIVVRVNYKRYGNEATHVGFYITSLEEQDITQITVNPEDSAVDLDTILSQ